jgi:uncharacterized protein (DUF305 family)
MKKLLFTLATVGTLLLSGCDHRGENVHSATPDEAATADTATTGINSNPGAMPRKTGNAMKAAMTQMLDQMRQLPASGNVDHDFAHLMAAHHKGALAMAEVELAHGQDATLRTMAKNIKADHRSETVDLEVAGKGLDGAPATYNKEDPADPFRLKMQAAMDGLMPAMAPETGSVDHDFAAMMLRHHQSAVAMVDAYLPRGKNVRLRAMARRTKAAHTKEIKQLQAWQATHGGAKATGAAYICPMKCAGTARDTPGKCPVCKMELVKNT